MNKFTNVTTEIDSLITDYEAQMAKLQVTLQEKMKDIFKSFFESFPEVKTIHWTQYTPYFNDGDECVFSVNEPYFTRTPYTELTEREHVWGEDDSGLIEPKVWNQNTGKYEDVSGLTPGLKEAMRSFAKILQSEANEAIMLAMFDNHVWVKAHVDGFDVDNYDHD